MIVLFHWCGECIFARIDLLSLCVFATIHNIYANSIMLLLLMMMMMMIIINDMMMLNNMMNTVFFSISWTHYMTHFLKMWTYVWLYIYHISCIYIYIYVYMCVCDLRQMDLCTWDTPTHKNDGLEIVFIEPTISQFVELLDSWHHVGVIVFR